VDPGLAGRLELGSTSSLSDVPDDVSGLFYARQDLLELQVANQQDQRRGSRVGHRLVALHLASRIERIGPGERSAGAPLLRVGRKKGGGGKPDEGEGGENYHRDDVGVVSGGEVRDQDRARDRVPRDEPRLETLRERPEISPCNCSGKLD